MMKSTFKIILLLFAFQFSFGQNKNVDSLILVLKIAKEDTNKVILLNKLAKEFSYVNIDSAFLFSKPAADLSLKLNYEKGYIKSLSLLANAYFSFGDNPKALESYLTLLKYSEKKNNKGGIAASYGGIANVKANEGNYEECIEYNLKALEIRKQIGDSLRISHSYINLGGAYVKAKKYVEGINAYRKALSIQQAKNNYVGAMYSYVGIAACHHILHETDTALNYDLLAYDLLKKYPDEDKQIASIILINIGEIYANEKKDYKKALLFFNMGLKVAQELNRSVQLMNAYYSLAELYKAQHNFERSLEFYQKYWTIKDSVFSSENSQQTIKIEAKYRAEKEERIRELEKTKKESEHQAEIKQRNIIIISIVLGLILTFVFALFIYRSLKQKQKANLLLEEKNHIIGEKNKDIMDSIHYAKRIQSSLLPTQKYIDRILNKKNKNT